MVCVVVITLVCAVVHGCIFFYLLHLCHLARIVVSCLLCFSCLLQVFILDHLFFIRVDYMYVRYEELSQPRLLEPT